MITVYIYIACTCTVFVTALYILFSERYAAGMLMHLERFRTALIGLTGIGVDFSSPILEAVNVLCSCIKVSAHVYNVGSP